MPRYLRFGFAAVFSAVTVLLILAVRTAANFALCDDNSTVAIS